MNRIYDMAGKVLQKELAQELLNYLEAFPDDKQYSFEELSEIINTILLNETVMRTDGEVPKAWDFSAEKMLPCWALLA